MKITVLAKDKNMKMKYMYKALISFIISASLYAAAPLTKEEGDEIFKGYRECLIKYSNMWSELRDKLDLAGVSYELLHKKQNPSYVLDFSWVQEQPLQFLTNLPAFFDGLRIQLTSFLDSNVPSAEDRQKMFALYGDFIPTKEAQLLALVPKLAAPIALYRKYMGQNPVTTISEDDAALNGMIATVGNVLAEFDAIKATTQTWRDALKPEALKALIEDTSIVRAMNAPATPIAKAIPVMIPAFRLRIDYPDQQFLTQKVADSKTLSSTAGWGAAENIMNYVSLLGRENSAPLEITSRSWHTTATHYADLARVLGLISDELIKSGISSPENLRASLAYAQRRAEGDVITSKSEEIRDLLKWLSSQTEINLDRSTNYILGKINTNHSMTHRLFIESLQMLKDVQERLSPDQKASEQNQRLQTDIAARVQDQYGKCEHGALIRTFFTAIEVLGFATGTPGITITL